MITSWDISINFVLKAEGGYVNDPHDPGGETNFGISKRSYPHLNIKALTVDDAKTIYHRDFWLPNGCENLAAGMDLLVFDTAVNMGSGAAQRLRASSTTPLSFTTQRILTYASFKNFNIYGKNWVSRSLSAFQTALTLAGASSNSPGVDTTPTETTSLLDENHLGRSILSLLGVLSRIGVS